MTDNSSTLTVALFHSVLGVRPGVLDAAQRFRDAGYPVRVIDQYDGQVFDRYSDASEFAESAGYPALMQGAAEAVADLPGPLVLAGFSNGGGMAEFVACRRGGAAGGVVGMLNFSGALPLSLIGQDAWPDVPVQLHYAVDDPFRNPDGLRQFRAAIAAAGVEVEEFLDYPGSGHLFTDESLPDEYHPENARLLFERALDFLRRAQIRACSV